MLVLLASIYPKKGVEKKFMTKHLKYIKFIV